ncbi:MAG: glycosyltransferase family 1 protein [bacterium]|nr:glycosyltransferase family 1 protein [bacterium]
MLIGIEASHAAKVPRTGVEEACWQMIEALKKEIPPEVEVVLYSHKNLEGDLGVLPKNWCLKILPWRYKKMWSQFALAKELFWHRPDVFFAPGQLLPWFTPKKTLAYIHDSAFLVVPEAYNFLGRKYLQLMNWWVMHRAHILVTSSVFNLSEIRKYYGEKIAAKVAIAPLAYDQGRYHTNWENLKSEDLKQKWDITKPYLIFIGRLETKKNISRLIEAFNQVKKYHDVQLVLVGKPGVGYEIIKQTLDNSEFKQDIKVLGWVDSIDLSKLLHSAKMLVFPSLYEGFGLPILEAMASGVPIVAGDIPALKEVGGEAALYANPYDFKAIAQKIIFLIENPVVSSFLMEKGLARVQLFTWQNTAKKIAKLIQICYSK